MADRPVDRFERDAETLDPAFSELLQRIPDQRTPPLDPNWLRYEMLERAQVIRSVRLSSGSTVLEVGAGSHAISTVPLAHAVGPAGRVIATELRRWTNFRTIVRASGLESRVAAVACDARRLPFRNDSCDAAACVHGVRSLRSVEGMVEVFREMLRVAPRIVLVETLPIARTDAQRAHLAMYDLREQVLLARSGRADDLHYLPLARLEALARAAGAAVDRAFSIEVDLPHALGYFPRTLVDGIADERLRGRLGREWDSANQLRERYGEDHPPIGIVLAHRPGAPPPSMG